jgi:hypothetical protein
MSDIDVIPTATDTADDTTEKTSNPVIVGDLGNEIDASLVLISRIKEESEHYKLTDPKNWYKDTMLNKHVSQLQNRVSTIMDQLKGLMSNMGSTNQDSSESSDSGGEGDPNNKITQLDASSVELINQKISQLSLALDSFCQALGDKFDIPQIKQARQFLIKFPDQIGMVQQLGLQKNEKAKEARRQRKQKRKGIFWRKWEQFKTAVLRKKKENEHVR